MYTNLSQDTIKNAEREKEKSYKKWLHVFNVISLNQNDLVIAFGHLLLAKLLSRHSMLSGSPPITKVWNHYTLVYHHRHGRYQLVVFSPFPQLNYTHKEANNRKAFHVLNNLRHYLGPPSMILPWGDMDVFVCLSSQSVGEILASRLLAHPELRSEKINVSTTRCL